MTKVIHEEMKGKEGVPSKYLNYIKKESSTKLNTIEEDIEQKEQKKEKEPPNL